MQDIFLSYSTQDRDRLTPLVDALEAQGWTVFWDHRSIKVADDWHDVVGTAIQECPCVIVVWSEASVTSRWVKEEALIARDRGVLYPLMLDRVAPPFGFTLMQAANFTAWNGKSSHSEFVGLKEQLSIRLKLRAQTTPQELYSGVATKAVSTQLPEELFHPGFALKGAAIVAVLAALGIGGYFVIESDIWSSPNSESLVAETPVLLEETKQEIKPVEATPSKVKLPDTYPLFLEGVPDKAIVIVNGEPYQSGQRFVAGSYTIKLTAEGYKPQEKQVEISEQNTKVQFEMERIRVAENDVAKSLTADIAETKSSLLPAELKMTMDGDQLVLDGKMSSQLQIDTLQQAATLQVGVTKVVNNLQVSDKHANADWLIGVGNLMGSLPAGSEAVVKDNTLELFGDAATEDERATLFLRAGSALQGSGLQLLNSLKVVDCQERLNNTMRGNNILFTYNKTSIDTKSYALLDKLGQIIRECSDETSILIGGHTDSVGRDVYNLDLSQRRADAVSAYLQGEGIDAAILETKGFGESWPVASNGTVAGQAKNRRITFEIKQKQ